MNFGQKDSSPRKIPIAPPSPGHKCDCCGWDFSIPHTEKITTDTKRTRPVTRSQITFPVKENGSVIAIISRCDTCYSRELHSRKKAQFSDIPEIAEMHLQSIRQDERFVQK
jgi:hypothetical protein